MSEVFIQTYETDFTAYYFHLKMILMLNESFHKTHTTKGFPTVQKEIKKEILVPKI